VYGPHEPVERLAGGGNREMERPVKGARGWRRRATVNLAFIFQQNKVEEKGRGVVKRVTTQGNHIHFYRVKKINQVTILSDVHPKSLHVCLYFGIFFFQLYIRFIN
jgi:hypothetical protein